MGWGAGGSVEAPAGPIAMCDSAHGDGAFGDGSICSGAEEQGLGQLDRRSRSLRHSGSAEGGWGGEIDEEGGQGEGVDEGGEERMSEELPPGWETNIDETSGRVCFRQP